MTQANPKADGCTIDALGRLPAVTGLKVLQVNTKPFRNEAASFWEVFITVEAADRKVTYKFVCREESFNAVTIVRREVLPPQ